MIRRLIEMMDGLTLKFLPAATPEISTIEPYWREFKHNALDVQHASLDMLRRAITRYTRHTKPNLDVETFLYRIIQDSV